MDDKELIRKHVESILWLRDELMEMDSIAKPLMGIRDWDDSVAVKFGGKTLIVSVDGPYAKRLVMKSALIHASTDVVVKGAMPLFALNTVIGTEPEIREMLQSLKRQAFEMRIPILGGNTFFKESEPRCSLTVIGELLKKEPIRDSTSQKGDILLLIGEPLWGEQEERIEKAKIMFRVWFEILDKGIDVHASKDVTKGGLVSAVYEMSQKSGLEFKLNKNLPLSMTRNLDNLLVAVSPDDHEGIQAVAEKNKCRIYRAGEVVNENIKPNFNFG